MKTASFFLITLLATVLSGPNQAHAGPVDLQRHLIQESLPEHRVKIRVIEEDTSLRDAQNQISQHLVFSTIVPENEVAGTLQDLKTQDLHPRALSPGAITPLVAGQPLWVPVKNTWSTQDEDDYSQWVASQITPDFNTGTGLFADCADVSLLFRWVYARDHKLPVANSLAGSGKLVGHFTTNAAWDSLPQDADWAKDERFKAALRYVFDNTYTRSVIDDVYPTQVTPQFVRAGSIFMIIRPGDGHAQTVKSVDPVNGITSYWGNEPASEIIFHGALVVEAQNKLTFGMWRWPVLTNGSWLLIPANQMPGYSDDQSKLTFDSNDEYQDWVDQQLGIHESDETRLTTVTQGFVDLLISRMETTAESLYSCVYTACAPGSAVYNNYSTFDRDARLLSEQQDAMNLINKLGSDNPKVQDLLRGLKGMGEIIPGTGLTWLKLFQDVSTLSTLKPDPRQPFFIRWGLTAPTGVSASTFTFITEATALRSLLIKRTNLIYEGQVLCGSQCNPNSTSVKTYSTATLDSGIRQVIGDVLKQTVASSFDGAALTNVEAQYQDYLLNLTDRSCGDHGCTYADAVFGPQAQARLKNWSPNPGDSPAARWGF